MVLLLRAVDRAKLYLEAYGIGTAPVGKSKDPKTISMREKDKDAKASLREVLSLAGSGEMAKGFDEGDFFAGDDAVVRPTSPPFDEDSNK